MATTPWKNTGGTFQSRTVDDKIERRVIMTTGNEVFNVSEELDEAVKLTEDQSVNGVKSFLTGASVGGVHNDNPIPGDNPHIFNIVTEGEDIQMYQQTAYNNGGGGSNFHARYARGTFEAPLAVISGDYAWSLGARLYDGSSFAQSSAAIQIIATENFSPTANGTKIQFQVTPNGNFGSNRITPFVLEQDGSITILKNIVMQPFDGNVLKMQKATEGGSSFLRFFDENGVGRGYIGIFEASNNMSIQAGANRDIEIDGTVVRINKNLDASSLFSIESNLQVLKRIKIGDAAYFVGNNTNGIVFNDKTDSFNNLSISDNGNVEIRGKTTIGGAPVNATDALRLTDLGTGWAQYSDNVYTSGSPLVINSGTTATVTNNAATAISNQLPIGVSSFYNSGTSKITPELNGDSYLINVRFTAQSSSVTGLCDVGIDIGGAMNIVSQQTVSLRKGIGNSQRVNIIFDVFSGSTFLTNGGLIKLTSIDGNTSIYDISYKITRTHKAK